MRIHRDRSKRGIAYIELMLATFITALGAVAVLSLVATSSRACKSNEYYTVASQIARAEIETIRSTKAYVLSPRLNADPIGSHPDLSQLPSGAVLLTVQDSVLVTGGKDITVTVRWTNPGTTTQRSVVLKTLVTPDGPTS